MRVWIGLFAAALVACAANATPIKPGAEVASPPEAAPPQIDPEVAEVQAVSREADALRLANKAAQIAPLIERALARHRAPGLARAALLWMRASLLAENGRYPGALRDIDAATAMRPGVPFFEGTAIELRLLGGDAPGAATRLIDFATANPAAVRGFLPGLIDPLLRALQAPEQAALLARTKVALAAIGYDGGQGPGRYDYLKRDAIIDLLAHDRVDEAAVLLGMVSDLYPLIEMASDARFARLWSAVEVRAGSDLALAVKARIVALDAARVAAPQDPRILAAWVAAMRADGRARDALSPFEGKPEPLMRSEVRVTIDAKGVAHPVGGDDPAWWVWNAQSDALADLGRFDEAIAVLTRTIAPIAEQPGLISLAINRVILLVRAGHYPQALADGRALAEASTYASPYGVAWIEAFTACAAHRAGDAAAKAEFAARLQHHSADNREAETAMAQCLERDDDAQASLLARLASDKDRGRALIDLQITRAPPGASAEDRRLAARLAAVRQMPRVQDAIAATGRVRSLALVPTW